MTTRRTRQAVGGTRTSGLTRIIGLLALAVADTVLLPAAGIAAGVYMFVDVLYALVLNRRASGNGLVMSGLKGIFVWVLDLHRWVFLGHEFPGLLPSRA